METQKTNIQIQDITFGFDTINEISKKTGIDLSKNKFNGIYGMGSINRRKSNSIKATKVHEFKWDSDKRIC